MKTYELMPMNGRKSFYGKAKVYIADDGTETLYSYDAPIVERKTSGELVRLYDGWSQTTGNHVKAFCGLNKAAFLNLPFVER